MMKTLVGLLLALTFASAAHAQSDTTVIADRAQDRVSSGPIILGAVLGSGIGVVTGVAGGAALGWGGGDDPGLASALLFGAVGSVVGTGLGIELGSRGRVPLDHTIGIGLISILGGIAGAVAISEVTEGRLNETGAVIGFSLGQGIFAGALAAGVQR